MFIINNLLALTIIFIHFDVCYNLWVIPERVTIDAFNATYIENMKANIRRYGRRSRYYFNVEGTIKQTWGDNISFHVILYEFLHNEYKRTFVEFHFPHLCKMIKDDPYVGKAVDSAIQKIGLTCPAPPGHWLLPNMSLPMESFPYVWPFKKAKAVGTVMHETNFVVNVSLYLRFEQN